MTSGGSGAVDDTTGDCDATISEGQVSGTPQVNRRDLRGRKK